MSLVNTETGEIIERPTYSQVRDSIATAREAGAKFFEQIVWQVERRAWEVLGYADWDALREAEYGDMGVVVPRADRPEIVTRMRRVGLTQQQIADTLGVSRPTVTADLNVSSDIDLPATIETPRGPRPSSYTKTPAPSEGEAPARDQEQAQPPTLAEPAPTCEMPAPAFDVTSFVESDRTVQRTHWQKNFMASIAKAGQMLGYTPADIAANADPDLIAEYERLIRDLSNHLGRVRGDLPSRLTAIKGGKQ